MLSLYTLSLKAGFDSRYLSWRVGRDYKDEASFMVAECSGPLIVRLAKG